MAGFFKMLFFISSVWLASWTHEGAVLFVLCGAKKSLRTSASSFMGLIYLSSSYTAKYRFLTWKWPCSNGSNMALTWNVCGTRALEWKQHWHCLPLTLGKYQFCDRGFRCVHRLQYSKDCLIEKNYPTHDKIQVSHVLQRVCKDPKGLSWKLNVAL